MKNNITSTLVVLLCCCFIACLKSSLNLIIEINKQQTADERGQQFFWFSFLQKERANNKSVTLRPAALDFIIIRLINSQLEIEVSFAVSLSLRTQFRKIIPG